MQDLQTTLRMETGSGEKNPPSCAHQMMKVSVSFRLPGYHHAGGEGVGLSASWSSNAGQPLAPLQWLQPLCEFSCLAVHPTEAGACSLPPNFCCIQVGRWWLSRGEGAWPCRELSPSAWPGDKGAAQGGGTSRRIVEGNISPALELLLPPG